MDGWTLMHYATTQSTLEIMKILIDNHIDINGQTYNMKRSALHEAVLLNKEEAVKLIIRNNGNPNILDC
jgi:ankyrin repeat protein